MIGVEQPSRPIRGRVALGTAGEVPALQSDDAGRTQPSLDTNWETGIFANLAEIKLYRKGAKDSQRAPRGP